MSHIRRLTFSILVALFLLASLGESASASNAIGMGGARPVTASGQLAFGNEPRLEMGSIITSRS
jgi:hypothetical protein